MNIIIREAISRMVADGMPPSYIHTFIREILAEFASRIDADVDVVNKQIEKVSDEVEIIANNS